MNEHMNHGGRVPHPTFLRAVIVWIKIGLLSFGGPAGQIALMHRELVDRRRWVSDRRFLHALNYCMLLPGPEAQQTATYIGWLLHGWRGGVAAGLLFVLPGALLMLAISYVYVWFGQVSVIGALFYGLKAAVLAIVASAVLRIGKKVLKNPVMWSIAALSFIAIFFFHSPFPLIILSALLIGLLFGRMYPRVFDITRPHEGSADASTQGYAVSDENSGAMSAPTIAGTLFTACLWLVIWLAPLVLCLGLLGRGHVLADQAVFFSKAALVTFGGAYAVLPYVAQVAVEVKGWLTAAQMMDGLGLAETTPGPLILVLQYVGFMGGWNAPGSVSPAVMAALASILTSWMTFAPGCLFIFIGGPWIERAHGNLHLATALSAVTAAVVGVILNLAIWFGWHLIAPSPGVIDWIPPIAGLAFFAALQFLRWDVIRIVLAGAALGLVLHLLGLR